MLDKGEVLDRLEPFRYYLNEEVYAGVTKKDLQGCAELLAV